FEARLAGAEDPDDAFRAAFPRWNPDVPGALDLLDGELDGWARNGRFDGRPVQVDSRPRISVQPIEPAEVHAIRILLWAGGATREGDDAALRGELDEGLWEDPYHPVLLRQLARRDGKDPLPLQPVQKDLTVVCLPIPCICLGIQRDGTHLVLSHKTRKLFRFWKFPGLMRHHIPDRKQMRIRLQPCAQFQIGMHQIVRNRLGGSHQRPGNGAVIHFLHHLGKLPGMSRVFPGTRPDARKCVEIQKV
ncbi:MAG: hypothetical protein WCH98_23780, partial [Verrucomicrobiota bacterium]